MSQAEKPVVEKKKKSKIERISGHIPFHDTVDATSVLEKAIDQNIAALLIGETGTGKTTCLRDLSYKHDKELIRVSVNGATSIEEIVGKWLLKENATFWVNGVLLNAMQKGQWIVFDEINAALPEVLFALHSVLDDDRKLMIAEKDGEIVRPHPDFRFFATMNPTINYAGTKEMNSALMSRFGIVIQMPHLTPNLEQELLQKFGGLAEDKAGLLTHGGVLLRKAWDNEQISLYCSTRDLLHAARLMTLGTSLKRSLEVAIVNKGETPEERNEVRKVLQEICKLEEEKKNVSYFLDKDLQEQMRKLEEQFIDAEAKAAIESIMRNASDKKLIIVSQQRDILLELLKRYIRPFMQALRDQCNDRANDKELSESSRTGWGKLRDKCDQNLKAMDEGEGEVKSLQQQMEDIDKDTAAQVDKINARKSEKLDELKKGGKGKGRDNGEAKKDKATKYELTGN